MYNNYNPYQHYPHMPMHMPYGISDQYNMYTYPYWNTMPMNHPSHLTHHAKIKDYGPHPFVINIEDITKENNTFRTALWTGEYLQLTLMSIDVGDDIGLEVHHDHDQFIRIEEGQGLVQMGDNKDNLDFQKRVYDDFAIFVPAGKWHNLINTGYKPLKLYSIYAPPEHPHGTVHENKAIAEAAEKHHVH